MLVGALRVFRGLFCLGTVQRALCGKRARILPHPRKQSTGLFVSRCGESGLFESRHSVKNKKLFHQTVKELFVVGVTGFEPTASWSRTKRATNCATPRQPFYYRRKCACCQGKFRRPYTPLSIIIKRTETQLSRLCVFSLLQPHRTEVRLTGKYRYLTFEDRKKIEAWHLLGDRPVDIAARLSVHHTTIYKELQRGATGALDANQREGYSAELAERRLRESFKRRGKRAPAAQ